MKFHFFSSTLRFLDNKGVLLLVYLLEASRIHNSDHILLLILFDFGFGNLNIPVELGNSIRLSFIL